MKNMKYEVYDEVHLKYFFICTLYVWSIFNYYYDAIVCFFFNFHAAMAYAEQIY